MTIHDNTYIPSLGLFGMFRGENNPHLCNMWIKLDELSMVPKVLIPIGRAAGPLKGTLAKFLAGQPIAGAAHANLKTITYLWFTHVHPRNHMWLLTPFYVWKNLGMKGKRPVIHVITGVNWSNQHSVGMKPCKEERWNHLLHIWVCLLKIRPYHKRLQNYQ